MSPSRLDPTTPAWPLHVDDDPTLILGGELGNSAASHPEAMGPLWDKLAALGLNTVLVPLSWELWEPEEGRFVPSLVDGLVAGAEARGLKLVLLWFGTWKNSMSCYVPTWVKRDQGRFARARTRDGRGLDILQVDDLPVAQLGAETQVQVLGEGVGPPAAGILDGAPTPDTGRSVELEKMTAGLAPRLLDGEMNVQLQGLQSGEQ